ncbi:ATP-binding protein [Pseudomonas asplenii]|uniref:ATP-binding protein n=1 Tax=Pseudomonas asplenii TaxID=53407 RepID=UPI0037CAE175
MHTRSLSLIKVYYRPIEAAIRWNNLSRFEEQILAHLNDRERPTPDDFPRWPGLLLKVDRIFDGMLNGELPYGKSGITCDDPTLLDAPDLTIRHVDLKVWMERFYADERPRFLFSPPERRWLSQATIKELLNDYHNLSQRLNEYTSQYQSLREENQALTLQITDLQQKLQPDHLSERSRSTLLNIIGGLLTALRGRSPKGVPFTRYESDGAIMELIIAHHLGHIGISERSMQKHFAAARRSLTS